MRYSRLYLPMVQLCIDHTPTRFVRRNAGLRLRYRLERNHAHGYGPVEANAQNKFCRPDCARVCRFTKPSQMCPTSG